MLKKILSSPCDLTIQQAAEQLNATTLIIRKAIHDGRLKFYKISPRNTRITQEALNEFRHGGSHG